MMMAFFRKHDVGGSNVSLLLYRGVVAALFVIGIYISEENAYAQKNARDILQQAHDNAATKTYRMVDRFGMGKSSTRTLTIQKRFPDGTVFRTEETLWEKFNYFALYQKYYYTNEGVSIHCFNEKSKYNKVVRGQGSIPRGKVALTSKVSIVSDSMQFMGQTCWKIKEILANGYSTEYVISKSCCLVLQSKGFRPNGMILDVRTVEELDLNPNIPENCFKLPKNAQVIRVKNAAEASNLVAQKLVLEHGHDVMERWRKKKAQKDAKKSAKWQRFWWKVGEYWDNCVDNAPWFLMPIAVLCLAGVAIMKYRNKRG
jgi:hypothetical protein